jgi:hypothetical protein
MSLNLPNDIFNANIDNGYPPFKNGKYNSMDAHFINYFKQNITNLTSTYIDVNWSAMIMLGLNYNKYALDYLALMTNADNGKYFTVTQDDYDPRTWANIPQDTIVFGSCVGSYAIPLLYCDEERRLKSKRTNLMFEEKTILCSFVGSLKTHDVRQIMYDKLKNCTDFVIEDTDSFIDLTNKSKFVLAPRGNGRASYRFYETLMLNAIPVYIWDDIEWLPFKELIDYDRLCVSINVKDIDTLPDKLRSISRDKYYDMIMYYHSIKYMFTMDFTAKYIIEAMQKIDNVEKDICKDAKYEYRSFCLKHLHELRKIALPKTSKHEYTTKEAVLIEFRQLPHLEYIIRNAIIKLGPTWSHTIICGNKNYHMLCNICSQLSPNIKIIRLPFDNISIGQYSLLLASVEFWNMLIGEKILIYQDDTCIFENNIDDFLEYDYIGGQFPTNIYSGTYVGNGGLSLRSKSVMLDVIRTIKMLDLKMDIDESTTSSKIIIPEDVYFCKVMYDYNIGKLADVVAANKFSAEHIYDSSVKPFGGHAFWNSIPKWQEYVREKTLSN